MWDGQSKEMEDALEVVNVVMVVSFLTEMVVRFLALGIKRYFRDAFNTLDFFINFISIMELAIGGSGAPPSSPCLHCSTSPLPAVTPTEALPLHAFPPQPPFSVTHCLPLHSLSP